MIFFNNYVIIIIGKLEGDLMANSDKEKKTTKKKVNRISNKKVTEDKKKTNKVVIDKKVEQEQPVSFNLIEVIIIMIITAVFGILIGSFVTYLRDKVIVNNPNKYDEFYEVYNEILNNYYEKVDEDELLDAGIEGMLNYLNDSYSEFLNKEEAEALNEELEGEFVGLGATIALDSNNQIYVYDIMDNSPASKSDLKVGDIITKVDDKSVKDYTPYETSLLVRGEEGTKCKLTILRGDEEKEVVFTRGKVVIPSVTSHIMDDSIGYIRVSVFGKHTADEIDKAIKSLKKDEINKVVIDLRSNNGGYLSVAEEISSKFLDKGKPIYQLKDGKNISVIKSNNKKSYDFDDVVILIDGGTASAAELMASSLSENNNYKLVGLKSYGKGTVQVTKNLTSGSMIKYTTQEWLTAKGNIVNKVGIRPNVEVNYVEGKDAQLEKAVELLK